MSDKLPRKVFFDWIDILCQSDKKRQNVQVLKSYGISGNLLFTFWRFLSDRHKISIQSKKPLGVIYLATCMPIFRLMGISKKKLSLVKKAEKWKLWGPKNHTSNIQKTEIFYSTKFWTMLFHSVGKHFNSEILRFSAGSNLFYFT